MKKVLFTTMSIIAVAAMMLVSCKKDNGDDNKGKDDNKPVDEYTGPVEGTSAWSVVGTLLESDWGGGAHGDYVMAEASEGIFVLKNVKLIATDAFKFRENKAWTNAYKGEFVTVGEAFDIDNTPGEVNIVPALEGIYDIYMNLTVEQAAIVAKDGAEPTWKEVVPEPITVDGTLTDWESIQAIETNNATSRIRAWKVISSEKFIYLYFALRKDRADNSRKLVIGFNTDKDVATGTLTDNNNLKGCEAIVKDIVPCTNASGAANTFLTGAGSGIAVPTSGANTENAAFCWGVDSGDASNVFVELSIPKAALALPATEIQLGASYDYYFTGYIDITL